MTWIKLDDGFPEHQVVLSLSDAAFRAYVEGLCYCGRNLTDGFIPVQYVRKNWTTKAVAELDDAALWESTPAGVWVANYLDHQESRESVEAKRDRDRQRKRKGSRKESVRNPDGIHVPDTDPDTEPEKPPPTPPAKRRPVTQEQPRPALTPVADLEPLPVPVPRPAELKVLP